MSTKKMRSCKNNPENSYTEKRVKHKPSDTHGVQYACLMIQKTCIFIGERIVLKSFVKI